MSLAFILVVVVFIFFLGPGFYDEVSMRKEILWSYKIINMENVGRLLVSHGGSEGLADKMFVSALTSTRPASTGCCAIYTVVANCP